MILKQSATNQLHFQPGIDLRGYELLTFSFYQNGQCVAKYLSTDTDCVKLNPDYSVDIYMVASVAKKFGPQRVSFEIATWDGDRFELLVSETMDVEICRSNERTSIVDSDDSEITDSRIRAEIERISSKYIPKNVSDKVDELDDKVAELEENLDASIEAWYEEHPEATTRIADGSVTVEKLSSNVSEMILIPTEHSAGAVTHMPAYYGNTAFEYYYISASGSNNNDGLSSSSPWADITNLIKLIKRGVTEIRVYLNGGETYDLTRIYSLNGVTIHFIPYGTGNVTVNFVWQTGSTYRNLSIYNSHINFAGTAEQEFIINGADPTNTTNINHLYFDGGSLAVTYTTINTHLTAHGAGFSIKNSEINSTLTVDMGGGAFVSQSKVYRYYAREGKITFQKCTFCVNEALTCLGGETDQVYNRSYNSDIIIYGATYFIQPSSEPSFTTYLYLYGGSITILANAVLLGEEGHTFTNGLYSEDAIINATNGRLTTWINIVGKVAYKEDYDTVLRSFAIPSGETYTFPLARSIRTIAWALGSVGSGVDLIYKSSSSIVKAPIYTNGETVPTYSYDATTNVVTITNTGSVYLRGTIT